MKYAPLTLKHLVLTVAILLVLTATAVTAQPLLDPLTQPKFVNPLPIPYRIDATNGGRYHVSMREATQWLGLVDPTGMHLNTTIWGYQVPKPVIGRTGRGPIITTYPGPTFIAYRDVPVDVRWHNKLPPYNMGFPGVGGHLLPVDPTMHMAHPAGGGIPTVSHLHGGHTESASDGLPEAWFTQGFAEKGPFFVKGTYHYDNSQEAATLWYHDHALGITRLNTYAGLAGFYLLRDDNEMQLTNGGVLPRDPYEIEVVIQDRMFDATGQLFFPSTGADIEPGFDPLPIGPTAIAEFFGDHIIVNGMAWPRLDVQARKYRIRLLNGSDSRFYVLELHDSAGAVRNFLEIGTENGLLEQPVDLSRLLIAPGERYDLVLDFGGLAQGTEFVLRNLGPDEPFKGFNPDGSISDGAGGVAPPADSQTTGQIMKFVVSLPLDTTVPDATVSTASNLRAPITPLVQAGATRNLVLFEGLDNYGRLQPLLGTLNQGSQAWFEPITENPMLNDVEVWEVYNATEDAHPIHLHLVSFQILSRESFEGVVTEKPQIQHDGSFGVGGHLTVTALGGDPRDPAPSEQGWKDTAVMLPGEVTRVIARFDKTGRYVWHCHILSHEDHEMMRPYYIGPMPLVGPVVVKSGDESSTLPERPTLHGNAPNPFNPMTRIRFDLPKASHVSLRIYDLRGRNVRTLADTEFEAGQHFVTWDGRSDAGQEMSSGVYLTRFVTSDGIFETHKLTLAR